MVVLLVDSGVYLYNFLKFSPCLHNLKKSSILPRMGLYCFQFSIFLSKRFLSLLYGFFDFFLVF